MDALPRWSLSVWEHAGFIAVGLFVYVFTTRVREQRRHPAAAIAWVMAIIAFPYLAIPLFLMFGTRKTVRPAHTGRRITNASDEFFVPQWASTLMASLDVPVPVGNEAVTFHADGERAFDELLRLIGDSRSSLVLGTYLIGNDRVGASIGDALIKARARGVDVRVLIDAVGCLLTSRTLLRQLSASGVQVREFMPLLHNPLRTTANLRNHRKVAVADGGQLWSGGRNLADEYFFGEHGHPAWLDLSFSIKGPIAAQALEQFDRDWVLAGGKLNASARALSFPHNQGSAHVAQWTVSGPDCAEDTVHALLMASAFHTRERILAASPYFVPDEALLDALCLASRRGVRVCLLLPMRSNHYLADWARSRALRRLHAAGADIRLARNMMHAKMLAIDDSLAICGSLNLDARSLLLNYEVMTAFYDPLDIQWLVRWHESQFDVARTYVPTRPSWWRDLAEEAVCAIAFQL